MSLIVKMLIGPPEAQRLIEDEHKDYLFCKYCDRIVRNASHRDNYGGDCHVSPVLRNPRAEVVGDELCVMREGTKIGHYTAGSWISWQAT